MLDALPECWFLEPMRSQHRSPREGLKQFRLPTDWRCSKAAAPIAQDGRAVKSAKMKVWEAFSVFAQGLGAEEYEQAIGLSDHGCRCFWGIRAQNSGLDRFHDSIHKNSRTLEPQPQARVKTPKAQDRTALAILTWSICKCFDRGSDHFFFAVARLFRLKSSHSAHTPIGPGSRVGHACLTHGWHPGIIPNLPSNSTKPQRCGMPLAAWG